MREQGGKSPGLRRHIGELRIGRQRLTVLFRQPRAAAQPADELLQISGLRFEGVGEGMPYDTPVMYGFFDADAPLRRLFFIEYHLHHPGRQHPDKPFRFRGVERVFDQLERPVHHAVAVIIQYFGDRMGIADVIVRFPNQNDLFQLGPF